MCSMHAGTGLEIAASQRTIVQSKVHCRLCTIKSLDDLILQVWLFMKLMGNFYFQNRGGGGSFYGAAMYIFCRYLSRLKQVEFKHETKKVCQDNLIGASCKIISSPEVYGCEALSSSLYILQCKTSFPITSVALQKHATIKT